MAGLDLRVVHFQFRFWHMICECMMVYRVRKARSVTQLSKSCDDSFHRLVQSGVSPEELYKTVCEQVSMNFSLFTTFSFLYYVS